MARHQLGLRQRRELARRDPDPLPADAPRYRDLQAEIFYRLEKPTAEGKMAQFDKQDASVREVDRVTGNLDVARRLVGQGIRSAAQAEPVVRAILESRQEGRRKL